jgi:hypothetical protein
LFCFVFLPLLGKVSFREQDIIVILKDLSHFQLLILARTITAKGHNIWQLESFYHQKNNYKISIFFVGCKNYHCFLCIEIKYIVVLTWNSYKRIMWWASSVPISFVYFFPEWYSFSFYKSTYIFPIYLSYIIISPNLGFIFLHLWGKYNKT